MNTGIKMAFTNSKGVESTDSRAKNDLTLRARVAAGGVALLPNEHGAIGLRELGLVRIKPKKISSDDRGEEPEPGGAPVRVAQKC